MKALKLHFPIILLALLEIAIGVLLLINAEMFMRWVIMAFGVIMLIVGVIDLIRWIKARKNGEKSAYGIIYAIEALIVGVAAIVLSVFNIFENGNSDKKTLVVYAVIFGVLFVILGFYKLQLISDVKKAKAKTSVIAYINVILAILLGAAVILLSIFFKSFVQKYVFYYAAVSFLLLALIDIISVIHAVALSNNSAAKLKEAEKSEKEAD